MIVFKESIMDIDINELEGDGSISIYKLDETAEVVATLEGLEVYAAIKNAISVLDEFYISFGDFEENKKLITKNASDYLKQVLNEKR